MVYSRATTSEMAERAFLPVVVVFFGCVEGLSFGIVAVWKGARSVVALSQLRYFVDSSVQVRTMVDFHGPKGAKLKKVELN